MAYRLFPEDYVGEPPDLPGLKLVQVPASSFPASEYAVVRFYRDGSGATAMRSILRTYDCADAKRQFRLLCRALRTGRSTRDQRSYRLQEQGDFGVSR
jgi:hypothetical protein